MNDLPTDREMVNSMVAGDEAAFDRFFREYTPRVFRLRLAAAPGRFGSGYRGDLPGSAGRAMRNIARWRGEASLLTWMLQIARNEITDHWRRKARRASVEVFAEDDPVVAATLESIQDDSNRPDQIATRADLLNVVHAALDRLPAHYGNALEWKYIDGLSVVEIGERLTMNPIATQSLLARARIAFRDAFTALAGPGSVDMLPFNVTELAP